MRNTQTSAFNFKAEDFLIGSDTNGQVYRTLMRFCDLPEIGAGGIVVNAKMNITAYKGPIKADTPALRTRPTDNIQVNIHRVTANWPEQGAVWNNYANSYNSIVEDYFIYNNTDDGFMADITELVSGWYSGKYSNYGIMLKANNESAANHVMQFNSSDWGINDTNSATWRPVLLINYRNSVGLENYWSYTTQDMGGYGTGYVNNYNGNLTYIHDDASFNSDITGFTLSHVFNSANSSYGVGRYGNGWGLNLVQYFEPVTVYGNDKVKFVYTDGDGTKHYFVDLGSDGIVDEDGLGYTYTSISEGELIYKLTDKDGNILKFDRWGALRRIIDTNNNTINLNYSPVPNQFNYLTTITTSSGGAVSLQYDSNYVLTSITDYSGRKTYFTYTNGNLTKITYPDSTVLNLGYSGNNLCTVTMPDGRKQSYCYYSDLKISSENLKGNQNTMTSQLQFNYLYNQTEIVDLSNRKLTYQFDTFGRPTCIYDSEGNSYVETHTEYSDSKNGIFANNKLSTASGNIRYINNLLYNSTFTNGLNSWTNYIESPNETQITVVQDTQYISPKSIKISSTASKIQAIMQAPSTSSNKTYTLSANIKTENVVSATHGAAVEIVISTPEGEKHYFSDFILGTTDPEINNGFVTASATAKLAADENITRITVGLYNASGTVWVDSIQLEEGDTANKINLLSNSSFERNNGNATSPTSFITNFGSSSGNGANTTQKKSGSYSCKIAGYPSQTRSIYQRINITGKAGDIYSIGGWGKADSVSTTYSSLTQKPNFRMYLNVYNGASIVEAFEIKFNENVSDWQYVSKTVILSKDYTMLEAFFTYDFNCNTAYFDDMFLYRDTMQCYTYDDKGNVVSTADYAKQQSTFEYNDNNLTKIINPNGTEYTYEYDINKNLKKASSNVGVDYDYTYDSYGNATSAVVSSETYGKTITSSATYQNNGNYPHTVTDSRGKTTTYAYDTVRGLKTGVTDANGNSTSYSYNSLNDRLNSVTSGSSTVSYAYENWGTLKSITAPSGTQYNFAYDEFGNTKTISVGSNILTENTYDTTRGLLTKSVYGNANSNGYTYDILDRITEKLYNNVVMAKFRYDKFGNLYEKQDLFTNITYHYNYDLIGRTTGVSGSDGTSLNYVYDDYNRIEKLVSKIGDNSNVTEYNYGDSDISGQKDGLIYGVKQNGTERISYSYDGLARLNKKTINTTTPFETRYDYLAGETNEKTTPLIRTMLIGDDYHNYFYDDVGNIIRYNKNGTNIEIYTYDSLNQLKTVTRGSDVYEYTYDNGGNIQSVTKNGSTIKTYGYTDTNWKDKLTSYNGTEITYDEIGNPRKYYDGSVFHWQYGRRLMVVKNGSNLTRYAYNADGLRTSKNVNGTITQYYWLDGVLLGQNTDNNQVVFLYDENGAPYGMVYDGTYYYYIQNAQGDIIGIIDADGNIVVEYTYSAWGETLSVTGSMASTIGQKNPLRYRGYYYDDETGFYLTGTRYYDPEIGRFINADGYVSTGQGVLGNNMFAYCGNNPVNRADPTGMFWKEIGDFFSKAWNGIKTWAKNTFGAGSSTTATIAEIETPVIPDPSPVTVKTGTKTTQTISKHGDSSKPISVYANKDAQHPIKSSSAGININIVNFTLDLSVGLDDIGISGSLTNGNTTNSFGVKLNLSELKIGFEGSTAIQWDNTTETAYTNASISGWAIAAAYILATTGQYVQSPSYAY